MLAPMSWIKRFVDINVDTQQFVDDMIMTGSEVEGYSLQGVNINKVVAGKIVKLSQHEDADKLQICMLDIGEDELLQVVTGADNVFEGAYVPVALVGATLPNGLKIKKGKLRGEISNGMLCSGGELKIDDSVYEGAEYDGIMILKGDNTPGMGIAEAIGYNDIIIDFKTYANRPDTLSIMGLARETSATFNLPFTEPIYTFKEDSKKTKNYVNVEIKDQDLCPRYMGKIVYDIKIAPSPLWMQKLLVAAGVRPINNIVDITNYVMLEVGQPMHAFDFKYVKDGKIIIRRATQDEMITTLDGNEYKLTTSNLVIADPEKPIALAGVMGGENSCIYDDTKVILFECANFNNYNIRRTSRQLGLRTESSARFEKGIDPAACERALDRAMHLVEQLGAGKIAQGVQDVNYANVDERVITVDTDRINHLLGQKLTPNEMKDILTKVFVSSNIDKNMLECTIPTYRSDLENYADIAEEVMRLYGYDKISSVIPANQIAGGRTKKQEDMIVLRNMMVSMGLYQSITYSFMSPNDWTKLMLNDDNILRNAVKISNPMGEEYSLMRTTLLPSMLANVALNKNHNINEVKLFEINRVYKPLDKDANHLPQEVNTLCIALNSKDEDFFSLKGRIELLLEKFNILNAEFSNNEIEYLHPGRRASVLVDDKEIGYIGELHPDVADNYQVSGKTLVAEVNVDILLEMNPKQAAVKPIPKYPAIQRDLAVLLDVEQSAGIVINAIKDVAGKLLENINVFDVYEGDQIDEGKKSVAFSLVFRAHDRTLVDDDVNKIFSRIIRELEKKFNAELRM
ncbi:MAG: phenylalanine--tRNA ligase subunit beta [Clostridiales bacterium]|nr:phenylalanine--tRNA ligase subunit beta [Clostridiales bacterium]